VPPEWPLYIVEFKAGRTDLFYRAADRMVSGVFVLCFGGGAFLLLLLCYDFICASIAMFAGADAIFAGKPWAEWTQWEWCVLPFRMRADDDSDSDFLYCRQRLRKQGGRHGSDTGGRSGDCGGGSGEGFGCVRIPVFFCLKKDFVGGALGGGEREDALLWRLPSLIQSASSSFVSSIGFSSVLF
jgi:hypothetical protein